MSRKKDINPKQQQDRKLLRDDNPTVETEKKLNRQQKGDFKKQRLRFQKNKRVISQKNRLSSKKFFEAVDVANVNRENK